MSRFARKTLRRLPPTTREIARLANELASVQTRLSNRVEVLASTEMMAKASLRIDCTNGAHANVINAALTYFKAVENPKAHAGEAVDALDWLRGAVEPFDPDKLFEDDEGPEPKDFEFS